MTTNKQHNDPRQQDDFLNNLPPVELPFKKSKEQVWSELSAIIDASEETNTTTTIEAAPKVRRLHPVWMAAAAIAIVLLATTAFFNLYTTTISAGAGQHLTAMLPDGSSVELNASSSIQYKPYWWRFNRELKFEGEGFFKVQKGKSFKVVSAQGQTIVLGTSFNIYARKNEYKVTCYTGKVRVVSVVSGASTDITPNQQAIVSADGKVSNHNEVMMEETISWINDMFIFTATPAYLVFEEIERQYGVRFQNHQQINIPYSGNFTRQLPADEVVHMVCRSLGLEYKKVNGGYVLTKQ